MKPEQKPLLTLCFICRNQDENELKTLPVMLDSIKDYVDDICVTVTVGEHRPLIESRLERLLKKYNCNISTYKTKGNIINGQWFIDDFSAVRNFNFSQAKTELVMWLDADDEVLHADKIPDALKWFTKKESPVTAVFFPYQYGFDESGNCVSQFPRERIVRKSIHSWIGRLHENCLSKFKAMPIIEDSVIIKHNHDINELQSKGDRNLAIIRTAYEQEKEADKLDPRTVFDFARSVAAVGQYNEAIVLFDEFMRLTTSNEDRFDTLLRMADIYLALDELLESKRCVFEAMDLNNTYPDAYYRFAKIYYVNGDWNKCLEWIKIGMVDNNTGKERAINITRPFDPMEYSFKPYKMMADCLLKCENPEPEKALRCVEKCLKLVPTDEYLIDLKEKIIKILNYKRVCESALVVFDALEEEGDNEKLNNYVNGLPKLVQQRREFLKFKNRVNPVDPKNRIVFFCERSVEYWNPDSAKSGIGGSEEAVINMAQQFKQLGFIVEVYNQCRDVKEFDGVTYYPYDQYDPYKGCEIFIAWRMPEYIMFAPKDSLKILWCHDIQSIEHYQVETLKKIDKIFVLSEYHRNNLPEIEDDKFFITRNGINPEHFSEKDGCIAKDMNNYIYASSPDRGLMHILTNWHKILEFNPKAHLHIFYGFTKVYDDLAKGNDARIKLKKDVMALVHKYKQSITWHGRVGHQELADWFMKCGFWLYPTDFPEISCHPAGTRIMTTSGEIEIEKLSITDNVITHTGKIKPINVLMRKLHRGKIYNFKVQSGNDFQCTEEHPIFVERKGKRDFIDAKDVTTNDRLLVPRFKYKPKDFVVKLNKNERINNLPTKNNINKDKFIIKKDNELLRWFCGYFAGDGNASIKTGKVSVLVADTQIDKFYQKCIDALSFFGCKVYERQLKGCKELFIHSYELAKALYSMFYKNKMKKIPKELFGDLNVFQGLMDSDGYIHRNYNYTYTSISLHLIGFMSFTLASKGFYGKTSKREHKNGNVSYSIAWTQTRKTNFYKVDDDYISLRIKEIIQEDFNDYVYNLEVADDNSFLANGNAVHNCITAMKAQAAGCWAIANDFAALKETIKFGGTVTETNGENPLKVLDQWVASVKRASTEATHEARTEMRKKALEYFSYKKLADEWLAEFRRLQEAKQ